MVTSTFRDVPVRTLPNTTVVAPSVARARSKAAPVTLTVWPARAWLLRPRTPLALEVRPRVKVASSAPAVAARTARLPEAPARILPGLVNASLALSAVPRTSRASWKLALVRAALATARLVDVLVRTLPRAKVAATVGWARS